MTQVIVSASAGSVRVFRPAPDVPLDRAIADLHRERLLTTPPLIMEETDLPVSRARRHAWRLQGNRIVDDPTVPDVPDLRQALRDEVASATTIAALKAALLKVLG